MKGILMKPWKIKFIAEHPDLEIQTRRVIKPQPIIAEGYKNLTLDDLAYDGFKPRYQVGETVYIKEAWCESYFGEPICYKLDGGESPGPKGFWRSPMFLKAVNARYFIKIKAVRAERLQEITPSDAVKEGVIALYETTGAGYMWCANAEIKSFMQLWDSINPKYPFESNPWVFKYSFKKKEEK